MVVAAFCLALKVRMGSLRGGTAAACEQSSSERRGANERPTEPNRSLIHCCCCRRCPVHSINARCARLSACASPCSTVCALRVCQSARLCVRACVDGAKFFPRRRCAQKAEPLRLRSQIFVSSGAPKPNAAAAKISSGSDNFRRSSGRLSGRGTSPKFCSRASSHKLLVVAAFNAKSCSLAWLDTFKPRKAKLLVTERESERASQT